MTDLEDEPTFETDDEAQIIELTRQPIDLYKILKFEGLVGSGGEAKAAIAEGHVTLNNVIETQKRKKVVSGDTMEFGGVLYRMHCDQELVPTKLEADVSPESNKGAGAIATSAKTKRKPAAKKAGRKAIGIKS